jgi:hypothetical protein
LQVQPGGQQLAPHAVSPGYGHAHWSPLQIVSGEQQVAPQRFVRFAGQHMTLPAAPRVTHEGVSAGQYPPPH